MRKCVVAMLTYVLIAAVAAADQPAATQPKIKIGRDTTRITAPLKADGTPDYIAALNKQYSRGVTPQNNAVVLILQALGRDVIAEEIRPAMLKALAVEGPARKTYFTKCPGGREDPAYESARRGPWRRADHPAVAKWLDENKAPLDLLVAASKRSRYFVPVFLATPDGSMVNLMLPNLSRCRSGARGLIVRANLAVGEGRIEQAWQDILAVHRLGVLMGQDYTLVGQFVGVTMGSTASDATARLATSGRLTAAQAKAILADMKALGPLPDIVTAIDQGERYGTLDLLIWFQKDFDLASKAVGMTSTQAERDGMKALCRQADFNDILRRANVYFDTLAAAMRKATFAERDKACENISDRLLRLKLLGMKPHRDKPVGGESVITRRTGTVLLWMVLPSLRRPKEIADVASVRRDLATVAVALAAHRAEQGSYPRQLSPLAGKYLKTVPDDLCGGKPFIYRRVGKGYLLYSVGQNMRHDGGAEVKPGNDDITVQAER